MPKEDITKLPLHSGWPYFSPVLKNGNLLNSSANQPADITVKLWDLKSQSCVATLTGHSSGVTALAVLPDGRVISRSYDNTLKLWDLGLRPLALPNMVPLFTAKAAEKAAQTVSTAASRQEFGFFKEQQESKAQTLEARLAQAEARAKAAEQAAQEAHQKAKKLEDQLSSPISGGSQVLAFVSPVAGRQGVTLDEYQLPSRVQHLESTAAVQHESHLATADEVAALRAEMERMRREQQKQSGKCLVM